jgi:hypothetical protein
LLPVWPTIIVWFTGASAVEVLRGSQADNDTLADIVRRQKESRPDVGVQVRKSLDALREAIVRRMAPALGAATELLNSWQDGSTEALIQERWRSLRPRVFAAGVLLLTVPLPGVTLGGLNRAAKDWLVPLALSQAVVWEMLATAWCTGGPHGDSLQADLDDFVSSEAVVPGAAEHYSAALNADDN